MHQFNKSRKLIILVTILITLQCTKIKRIFGLESNHESKVVVIFVNGNVSILRDKEKFQPKVGALLESKDIILTESGSLDIQNKSGDLIRVKSFSKLSISSFDSGENTKTSVDIQWGELIVKTKKLKSNSEFRVLTPTTVAGVRGTVFTVELQKDKIPQIKVFEGSVAVGARFQPIHVEQGSVDQESYDELISFLEKNEIILGTLEESNINPKFQELVLLINNRKAITEDFDQSHFQKQITGSLDKETFPTSPQKTAEIDTLVGTDSKLILDALESKTDEQGNIDTKITESITNDQTKNLDSAISDLEEKAKAKNLNSEADIQNYYSVLEVVNMNDGNQFSGAIITQVARTVILHSTEGIKKLNLDQVDSVDYKTFQMKTKSIK